MLHFCCPNGQDFDAFFCFVLLKPAEPDQSRKASS